MFTCCPECQTCFRITEKQLAIAKGLVRCGHCHKVFNGSENLTAALPADTADDAASDPRHEADEHDSGIFTADFLEKTAPHPDTTLSKFIEESDDNKILSTESDHFDLPSFSAKEDDDRFIQATDDNTPSTPAQIPAKDSYTYTDIADDLKEEKNIEDIFSDMHQQLELGISELEENEPGTGILDDNRSDNKTPGTKKSHHLLNDEDEINQAIDNIFADSDLPLYGEERDDQDYRVEKEMLAAFGKEAQIDSHDDEIKFEDEAVSLSDLPHALEDELPGSSSKTPASEADIPRRLRDSLAISEPEKISPWKILTGLLLILLLSIALLAQFALFRGIEIVNYFPQSRPWLEQFCHYAPCRIHARRDIDRIRILERDIRAHPKDKKALLITASIINKASFNQPYPDIEVTLSDLSGAVVAQRRFTPADYLGELNSPFLLMKSGTPVHIRIGVLDPGRDAVNFEFQFL